MIRRSPTDEKIAGTFEVPRLRQQAIDFLLGRINYERWADVPYGQRHLKLDRMRQLLTRLGSPDAGMPIVHVAGTKGKGSTSAMVGAMLSAAGYETGVFSSPHLQRLEERFSVGGVLLAEDELVALVAQLRTVTLAMDRAAAEAGDDTLRPTYFELITALALMHFARQKVDIAVMEVGLGGRLDSTNVCQPIVSVITSISFDHTKQLGNTLEEIAAEKAGIIKPGIPVLCGPMPPEAGKVIARIARQHGCRLLEAGRDFRYQYYAPHFVEGQMEPGRIDYCGTGEATEQDGEQPWQLKGAALRLLGKHQAANAALALATIDELRRQGWSVSTQAICRGLAELTLPARIEPVGQRPTVLLDVAHNVASAAALVEVLEASFGGRDRTLLLAVSRDKDVRGIVRLLLPHFRQVVVTEYRENPRAVPTGELAAMVREEASRNGAALEMLDVWEQPMPLKALRLAQEKTEPEQLLCVTGSFFIAAELRGALLASAAGDQAN